MVISKSIRDKVYKSEIYEKNTPEEYLIRIEAFNLED